MSMPWVGSSFLPNFLVPLSNTGCKQSLNSMFSLDAQYGVYLGIEPVDFRKHIDGIALQVQESLEFDPYSPALFVFRNRSGDKLKLLYWYHNGFVLVYRRLEKGRFKWRVVTDSTSVSMSLRELNYILSEFCDSTLAMSAHDAKDLLRA